MYLLLLTSDDTVEVLVESRDERLREESLAGRESLVVGA